MRTSKICDHKSVGMLVWQRGKLLLIERMKFPFGFAPPSGHLDEDGDDFENAAKRELEEEVGLKTKFLKPLIAGRKENLCRRVDGTWHYWQIFEADAEGEIKRSKEETKQVRWVSKDELLELAGRCEEFQAGKISEDDWKQNPGLEPVWYEWMKAMKMLQK